MFRLLAAGVLAVALPAAALAAAVVESLTGSAQVGEASLRQGERIFPGAVVTTGPQARLRLRFDDGMEVLLEERSHLRLVDFRYAKGGAEGRVVLDLLAGAARVITGEIVRTNPDQFFLRTPQASFGVEDGSDFSIALADGAYVAVSQGTVTAANRAGTAPLTPGPTALVASAGAPPTPVAAPPQRVVSALGSLGSAAAPRPPVSKVETAPLLQDGRAFVGASVGRSDVDEGLTTDLITSGSVKGNGTGFKVFGGYQFNRTLGLELAFVELGEARYEGSFSGTPVTGGRLKVTGFNVALLGRVPLGERFAALVKIGAFLWELDARDISAGMPFSKTSKGGDPSLGIGADYSITRDIAVRAEGELFRIARRNTSLVSLGVVFSF